MKVRRILSAGAAVLGAAGSMLFPAAPAQAAVPGQPTGLHARPGLGSAVLTFRAPADAGITGYQYTVGDARWNPLPADGRITQLIRKDRPYSVRVRALDGINPGPPSEAIEVLPGDLPAAPASVTATPGRRQALLSVTPGPANGKPILGYQVSVAGAPWKPFTGSLTALQNNRTYAVRVRAVTAYGAGTPIAVLVAMPALTPAAPAQVKAVPGDRRATLSFRPPADDGGTPVTGYQVSTGAGWSPLAKNGTITGLQPARKYAFQVRAVNKAGAGDPSPIVPLTGAAAPATPVVDRVTAGDRTADVFFTGSAATYQVSVDGGAWRPLAPTTLRRSGSGTQIYRARIVKLRNGTAQSVRLRAVNAVGPGTPTTGDLIQPGPRPASGGLLLAAPQSTPAVSQPQAGPALPVPGRSGTAPYGVFLLVTGLGLLIGTGRRYLLLPAADPIR